MNEKKLYQKLKKNIFDKLPGFYYDRLESKVSSNGLPDIVCSYRERHAFIELKYVDSPLFRPKNHVSASQLSWLISRGYAGGYCWLCIGTPDTVYFIPHTKLDGYMLLDNAYSWKEIEGLSAFTFPMNDIYPGSVDLFDVGITGS